jgi:hypothetical protein
MTQVNAWVDLAAHICHEANRAIQIQTGDPVPSPKWTEASDEQKNSAREGVAHVILGRTPEELHNSWCLYKWGNGWIWGPVKDEVAKTHPCLVRYSDLAEEQKLKDHVFSAIVQTFVDAALLSKDNL